MYTITAFASAYMQKCVFDFAATSAVSLVWEVGLTGFSYVLVGAPWPPLGSPWACLRSPWALQCRQTLHQLQSGHFETMSKTLIFEHQISKTI